MELYQQIFLKQEDQRIFPGESFAFSFDYQPREHAEYRLFFTGETDAFYWWKSEYCCTAVYKRISNSLVRGRKDAWGLRFTGADYPVLAFRKLVWKPELGYLELLGHTDAWRFGVTASARDVRIKPGGYLRLCLEIRNNRDDCFPRHTNFPPDQVLYLDLPEGSYDLRELSGAVTLPDSEIANVQFILEGENFEGEVVFEAPYLRSSNGYNMLAPFAPDATQYHRLFNWFGVNLSKAEWPAMQILLNGQEVFCDEFFERCHRYSEMEFTLPADALLTGENQLEFRVISDCHDALPYRLHEVGIVREDRHSFDVVSCPEIAVAGKEFALLLDLTAPAALQVESQARVCSPLSFCQAGLQALRLVCDQVRNDLTITLSDGITTHTVTVPRVIQRQEDQVITGTGDLIYVNQDDLATKNFFKWYMQNHIGNLLTIRPTYRWSGTRKRNDAMWQRFVTLLNALGMRYSHMLDGREPQGFCANPSIAELSIDTGEPSGFLGRQLHERDGAYCYWGDYVKPDDFWDINNYYDAELYFDQLHRQRLNDPAHAGSEFYHEDFFDDGKRYWLCHDPALPADMEVQAKAVMGSLIAIRKGSTRHTGPSILFKYFCMTGYSWIGAETMDSPTEFLMAALRGTAEAYHIPTVGVHHALQWSTSPHEDPRRYRRYRLALYTAWMQGAHEHNTEEGLWHMEEFFEAHHRHGKAAKAHLAMQQDFFRWVSSHSRQGRLHAPVGILQGRYDGYPCFGGGCVWGRSTYHGFDPHFDAEESWHIPRKSFYPNGVQGWTAVRHKCEDGPIGLVSHNPRGNFNILPIEADWKDYPFLCFFGYNKAEPQDLDRLLRKVNEGATVLLTLAHLSPTTNRADIEHYRHSFAAHPILKAMGFATVPSFEAAAYNGCRIPLACNLQATAEEILLRTPEGHPLLVEKKCGKGSILFFNTLCYPGHKAILADYTREFEARCDALNAKEDVFPIVGDTVQSAVYDLEDGTREIYFLAVDWWNDPDSPRQARLRIDGVQYPLEIPFGVIQKIVVKNGTAIVCQTESADVLEITPNSFLAQGVATEAFRILQKGTARTVQLDFTRQPQIIAPL